MPSIACAAQATVLMLLSSHFLAIVTYGAYVHPAKVPEKLINLNVGPWLTAATMYYVVYLALTSASEF